MKKKRKKRATKSVLVGKDVRVVVGDWVVIKTKEGVKLINKSDCILIEEFK